MRNIIGLSELGIKVIAWAIFIVLSTGYLIKANSADIYTNDKNEFLLAGQIEENDAVKILHVPQNEHLLMESIGGAAWEGLAMGHIIRSKNVSVESYETGCYSACAYAAVMSPNINGTFHFHAPYTVDGIEIPPEEEEYTNQLFTQYLKDTGRFNDDEIKIIMNTGPEDFVSFEFKDNKRIN